MEKMNQKVSIIFQSHYVTVMFSASVLNIGLLSGSIVGGWQCGKFGRRKAMLIDFSVFFFGIALSAVSPNFYVILIARIIAGTLCSVHRPQR